MVRLARRMLNAAIDLSSVLGSIAVILMMVHVSADVVAQFVFSRPLTGTIFVVSDYYMVIVTFVCLALVERREAHITVEVLTDLLPDRFQVVVQAFGLAVSAVIFGLLTWQSFLTAQTKWAIGTFEIEQGLKIVTWPSYYLVPAGALLMTVTVVAKLIRAVVTGRPTTVNEEERIAELPRP